MKVEIEERNGKWSVKFTHGIQTFHLALEDTKELAELYKKQLETCFKNFLKDGK